MSKRRKKMWKFSHSMISHEFHYCGSGGEFLADSWRSTLRQKVWISMWKDSGTFFLLLQLHTHTGNLWWFMTTWKEIRHFSKSANRHTHKKFLLISQHEIFFSLPTSISSLPSTLKVEFRTPHMSMKQHKKEKLIHSSQISFKTVSFPSKFSLSSITAEWKC